MEFGSNEIFLNFMPKESENATTIDNLKFSTNWKPTYRPAHANHSHRYTKINDQLMQAPAYC